jgi:hypothetical protein
MCTKAVGPRPAGKQRSALQCHGIDTAWHAIIQLPGARNTCPASVDDIQQHTPTQAASAAPPALQPLGVLLDSSQEGAVQVQCKFQCHMAPLDAAKQAARHSWSKCCQK